jgi:hypothetical protein
VVLWGRMKGSTSFLNPFWIIGYYNCEIEYNLKLQMKIQIQSKIGLQQRKIKYATAAA